MTCRCLNQQIWQCTRSRSRAWSVNTTPSAWLLSRTHHGHETIEPNSIIQLSREYLLRVVHSMATIRRQLIGAPVRHILAGRCDRPRQTREVFMSYIGPAHGKKVDISTGRGQSVASNFDSMPVWVASLVLTIISMFSGHWRCTSSKL